MSRLQLLAVSALNRHIRSLIEADELLSDVWVEGEVSSVSRPASGHVYLKVKDADSVLDATMWRSVVARQSFMPRVGDQVAAHGAVTVYEKAGKYQLAIDVIHPAGAGLAQLELERLRQQLESEGLFDSERKRPLPSFPRRIGVVTSATGAVWHDIQQVVQRRFPLTELILVPGMVQGEGSALSVVDALSRLNHEPDIDVIIVARGGGSVEDLWSFNDERVVRAIFASRVPVVSAIGHETDFTLADFVADARASTPSVAAEMVVPNLDDLAAWIDAAGRHLESLVTRTLEDHRRDLASIHNRLQRESPLHAVTRMTASMSALEARLHAARLRRLEHAEWDVQRLDAVLHAMSPSALLERGYSLLTIGDDSRPISKISDVRAGSSLRARVRDGVIHATVDESSARTDPTMKEAR